LRCSSRMGGGVSRVCRSRPLPRTRPRGCAPRTLTEATRVFEPIGIDRWPVDLAPSGRSWRPRPISAVHLATCRSEPQVPHQRVGGLPVSLDKPPAIRETVHVPAGQVIGDAARDVCNDPLWSVIMQPPTVSAPQQR
jgi:hypothetical protein